MTKILYTLFLGALAAYGQQVTLSDTLTNAVGGGSFTGRVTVTLNAPGSASPLYYSTTSLTGWQAVYCIGVTGADCTTTTSAGTFSATLYANSTITPAGTSYSARFQPAKGAAWSETWSVEPSDTKLYQVRTSTVPSPAVMFQPSQLTAGGASNGSCLVYDGTTWEPGSCSSGSGTVTSVAATVPSILSVTGSPITTSGTLALSLATQTANTVFAGPTTGSAATPTFRSLVSADIPANAANTSGNAGTATALAANGTNCSAGSYPLGVDASGNAEGCTVASGGSGTVTSVSVATANGVSGSVATATTTPAISLTLGAITPTSVAAGGTVTGSNLSGTNTGDQTTITGNAGTATALAANPANCSAGTLPRGVDASGAGEGCAAVALASEVTGTLANSSTTATALNTASAIVARDGSGNFAAGTITAALTGNASTSTAFAANGANCSAGSFPLGVDASGASESCTALPTTISGTANQITASASTGAVTLSLPATITGLTSVSSTGFTGALTGNASTSTAFAANGANCSAGSYPKGVDASGAAESCSAVSLTADVSGILPVANGGTDNAFFTVAGPATSAKTYTFPNASATVLTSNAAVTIAQGGTGTASTLTGLVRGSASAMTAAELSGDATTSGSNAITVIRINGTSLSGLATGLLKNTTGTGVPSIAVAGTDYSTPSSTDTLTNKTYNVASTGNAFTDTSKITLITAGCQNATAALFWDTPTTNPAVAACVTGTNTQKGVADFADGANSLSMQTGFLLPSDWVAGIDAKLLWLSSVTTGDVVWQVATICTADAETDDPAFNTASTVTDTTKGTTNQLNTATITGITATGCAAGEFMHVKVFRDPTHASDTMAGTARLMAVELTLTRTQ